jgi:hypothetical protein
LDIYGDLSAEIPVSEFNPEFYLKPTDKRFSLQVPTIQKVHRLLETLDEKKSIGLDNIPSKLLKIAADVVAPLLTEISSSIYTGIFPNEWKEATLHEKRRIPRYSHVYTG